LFPFEYYYLTTSVKYSLSNFGKQEIRIVFFRALGNFSSFGFLSVGNERWQKPKVLKYAAGQYVLS